MSFQAMTFVVLYLQARLANHFTESSPIHLLGKQKSLNFAQILS